MKTTKILLSILLAAAFLFLCVPVAGTVPSGRVLTGDVDGDGVVTAMDHVILTRYLAGWPGYDKKIVSSRAADVNGDGKVSALDRLPVSRYLDRWDGYEETVRPVRTDTVTVGVVTKMQGDLAYGSFTSGINTTDSMILELTDDCVTVTTDQGGAYVINESIVEQYTRTEAPDGSVTYFFRIKEGLTFNNGEPIKAENFLAWTLFVNSPAGEELGTLSAGSQMFPGGDRYHKGESDILPGLRLLGEYEFSITVLAKGYDGVEYLPYYFDLAYAGARAVNLRWWFGEGWHVCDDGEGAALVHDDGVPFTADNIRQTVKKARYATSGRITAGPYNLMRLDREKGEATLAINPTYAGNFEGRKPSIGELRFVTAEEDSETGLLDGTIGVYYGITDGGQIDRIAGMIEDGTLDFSLCEYERAGYGKITFRCDFGPTQFAPFRQALAYLTDREGLTADFCGKWGKVVDGPYSDAMKMAKDFADTLKNGLIHYALDPEKAVALLKEAGFVCNEDGSAYVDGSGKVRYRKVTEEEAAGYLDVCGTDGEGNLYLPAEVRWAYLAGNPVSQKFDQYLADADSTREAGVRFTRIEMGFDEVLNYLYRNSEEDPKYGNPVCNMFNMATGFSTGTYDMSFSFTSDPELLAVGYNETMLTDGELDRLSMEMVYGVTSDEYERYLDLWRQFVTRFNKLLPELPLYMNLYVSAYSNEITDYQENSFWGFERAILYARMNPERAGE